MYQQWRKLTPAMLRTSYCQFYGTHFVHMHDKPSTYIASFDLLVIRKLVPSFNVEIGYIKIGPTLLI